MSAVTTRVSNDLRNRIVAVLRENREVRNIGALADQLEAAIRAAGPVAYLRHGEETPVQNVPFGAMWISDKNDPRAFPVYDCPRQPAPFVAVKVPRADWIKHDGKSIPVNGDTIVEVRMASGFEYDADFASNWLEREGSKSNWHHDLGCPHPCDIVAYRIVTNSPTLSTQVQDVAVAEIVSAHGDPEAFGERELVTLVDIQKFPYRTKLYAAAPAKQEGSFNE
ncbi:hypothetical protein [Agrobacterium radiobacter]